jgi:lipopolysaccharide export LptBFGC system permease protein LptF
LLALLIYLVASNLFSALTATVTQGRLGLEMAWWPLPALLLSIAAAMMWWRMR